MFGPNTSIATESVVLHSHRDKEFMHTYGRLKTLFTEVFRLGDYDIIFMGGSGTTAIESVVWSLVDPIEVVGNEGVFRNRWERLVRTYGKEGSSKYRREKLYCQLETSNSSYHEDEGVVDVVSSFPYYDIPKSTNIFITCVNKQLGSFPGLAIIGVKKNYWTRLKDSNEFSYLNLRRYYEYGLLNQTPTTTPTQIYDHFLTILKRFSIHELRDRIDRNSKVIADAVGEENIIGLSTCPVITIPKENIPMVIAEKWGLYGVHTKSKNYQIFTYSNDGRLYREFVNDLK
tara:strand:- start:5163 stop:6023 length:861 start_codon:yes stop_codon:yes gene_type:complete